jgi:ribosomal protein L7/L12
VAVGLGSKEAKQLVEETVALELEGEVAEEEEELSYYFELHCLYY